MVALLALLTLLRLADPAPATGVPPPPGGRFEAEMTKVVLEKAKVEMKSVLDDLERTARPPEAKAEIRRRLARLSLAVYTTPAGWEETVAYYEGAPMRLTFLKGERDILADLREWARTAGLDVEPSVAKALSGKLGKTARWTKDDDTLQVVVEDHLIDPRDGKVSETTVVLVTSLGG